MKFIAFETLDSTSAKASVLLRDGTEQAPFAVFSDVQTAGRGRGGNTWASVAGNIHLTLALRPDAEADIRLMPLKAAVIVARWMENQCAVRPTLKWPNDLLFAGIKLGGILCEAHYRGSECQAVLVGIGLNVTHAPSIDHSGGNTVTTCLRDIRASVRDARTLAAALCRYWEETTDSLSAATILPAFEAYAIEPGHLWVDGAGSHWQSKGCSTDGSLLVLPPKAPADSQPTAISDAGHGLRWIFGDPNPLLPIVVADTGNTATKLAIFANARAPLPQDTASYPNEKWSAEGFKAWLDAYHASRMTTHPVIFWASVAPSISVNLQSMARSVGWSIVALRKRPLLRHGKGYSINELGVDRLAIIESHLSWLRRENKLDHTRTSILISAGTATTIDVVRDDGEHLGGLILPGIETALDSLHQKGAQLPDVAIDSQLIVGDGLGHGTLEALRCGVVQMTVGAIDRALQVAASCSSEEPTMIVTGGLASIVTRHYDTAIERQHMTLDGIRLMALGG